MKYKLRLYEIKSTHRRSDFTRRRRISYCEAIFHPPARVDLVEKAPRRVLFLVRMTGFEPAASSAPPPVCGARYLPCRRSGYVSYRPLHQMPVLHLPPAADRHLTQSKCLALFARCRIIKSTQKTQRELPTRGSSLCVVRMTGFEPAASCSQSKRSTKLSHIRLCKTVTTTQRLHYTRPQRKKQSKNAILIILKINQFSLRAEFRLSMLR